MREHNDDQDRHARVRSRAYERYLTRGQNDGQDLDDWLEAEHQIAIEEQQARSTDEAADMAADVPDSSDAAEIAQSDTRPSEPASPDSRRPRRASVGRTPS